MFNNKQVDDVMYDIGLDSEDWVRFFEEVVHYAKNEDAFVNYRAPQDEDTFLNAVDPYLELYGLPVAAEGYVVDARVCGRYNTDANAKKVLDYFISVGDGFSIVSDIAYGYSSRFNISVPLCMRTDWVDALAATLGNVPESDKAVEYVRERQNTINMLKACGVLEMDYDTMHGITEKLPLAVREKGDAENNPLHCLTYYGREAISQYAEEVTVRSASFWKGLPKEKAFMLVKQIVMNAYGEVAQEADLSHCYDMPLIEFAENLSYEMSNGGVRKPIFGSTMFEMMRALCDMDVDVRSARAKGRERLERMREEEMSKRAGTEQELRDTLRGVVADARSVHLSDEQKRMLMEGEDDTDGSR